MTGGGGGHHSHGMNPDADTAARIREAFALARDGAWQRAEAMCHEILAGHFDQPEALLLRAVIEVQTGRVTDGAASVRRSLQGNPSRPAAHALLGDALSRLNRPEEALDSYEAALRFDRNLASAICGRGNALAALRRPLEALASYDEVLALRPDDAEAWCKRGNVLHELGRFDAAVQSYDHALGARPAYADAFNNRGGTLLSLKLAEAALASFDSALAVDAACAEAAYNRGCALGRLERLDESLGAFDHALQLRPDYPEALCGCGDVLQHLQRPGEALHMYSRALQLHGGSAAAAHLRNRLGDCLRVLKRFSEAIECYDEALRLNPDDVEAHHHRGIAILQSERPPEEAVASYARVLQLNPRAEFVPGALFHVRQCLARWPVEHPLAGREQVHRAVLEGLPAAVPFHFLPVTDSARAQLSCAQTYVAHRHPGAGLRWDRAPYRHRRVRVAYVSSDFRRHAVSYLMAGVFERHDRQRVQTVGISLSPEDPSSLGQRVKGSLDRFIDVSHLSDSAVIALLRELEIDIAVDLNGFTDGGRPGIFRGRAAPVQVSYLGFPGTMGAPFMDYILADSFVIPAQHRSSYSEKVVHLPHCFQPGDDRRAGGGRAIERAEADLPADDFVFCCLNNTYKITPSMFDLWMRLLDGVPDSVLWLLAHHDSVRANLRREAANRGVDPGRLLFAARVPYSEYLSRLKLADLFLDTLPFNAGTTAGDALWAGLPLLTCSGEAFASRMAGSLLRAAGVPELIAADLAQYEMIALDLARNRPRLDLLRRRLAENRGAAPFDTDRCRRHLESAYEEMRQRHERGEDPSDFAVSEAAMPPGPP